MTAFCLVVPLIFGYLDSTKFISIDSFGQIGEWIIISLIFISPIVGHILIFPQYKKKYPNVNFFKNKIWSLVSYLLCLLVIGIIVFLPIILYVV
jgi:hypothetical protein